MFDISGHSLRTIAYVDLSTGDYHVQRDEEITLDGIEDCITLMPVHANMYVQLSVSDLEYLLKHFKDFPSID